MKLFKILAALAVLSTPATAATFGLSHGWELTDRWATVWNDDVPDLQNGFSYLGAEIGVYEQNGQTTHQFGVSIKGYDGTQSGSVMFKYFGREMEESTFHISFGGSYNYYGRGNVMVTKVNSGLGNVDPMEWNRANMSAGHVVGSGDMFVTAWTDIETNWTPPPSAVPLPAGGLLILTALGGLAAMRTKVKK